MDSSEPARPLGRLYGIGVGPGDPELLTLKAARLLRQVPVIGVPVTRPGEDSYALRIVRDAVDLVGKDLLPLLFPMTRDATELQACWEAAADALAARLLAGQDCAFLTEGDPFFYSTFIYIFDILRHRHPDLAIEVVPAVSSLTAASARSLTPLLRGDERLAVLPATAPGLADALRSFDTVVLFKVGRVFDAVLDLLEELGLAESSVLVQRATTDREAVIRDLRSLRGRRLDYFSLLIVRTGGAAEQAGG